MFAPSSTAALLGLLLGTLSVSSSPLAPRWSSSNPAANTANSSTTTDLPLAWTPFGFVTDAVEIGTPAQKIPSFVDWTWIGQYAFSTLCNDSTADTYDCLAKDQTIFNQSASSTFENQSSLYPERNWNPNHFFFYKDLKVEYGSDIERVGGVEGRVTIMAADMDFNLSTKYPFAGVFGLSPVFDTDNGEHDTTPSLFSPSSLFLTLCTLFFSRLRLFAQIL